MQFTPFSSVGASTGWNSFSLIQYKSRDTTNITNTTTTTTALNIPILMRIAISVAVVAIVAVVVIAIKMRSRKSQIVEKAVVPIENVVKNNHFEQTEAKDTVNNLKIEKKSN